MKIFTTQLTGLIKRLNNYEEDIEDASRAIAQSVISDGRLFWCGDNEMEGLTIQACSGEDRIPGSIKIGKAPSFTEMDTLVTASSSLENPRLEHLADEAKKQGATVISICSGDNAEKNVWQDKADFSFNTHIQHGLVPMESGNRIGKPHLLIGLHIYYRLYFSVMEILEEHDM
ncbi:DUF2529 domain-containing protein [Salipaludibacillus sp. CUR1]|uniref:DUF2529 family protein n=1 Tax=Salipaludibacillus sp. CUR1 TaxID=2820003 RepID=UPI001E48DC59|nr:DUF2529 family protein [Salipaludibacillus sp. CUR1]MCE7792446.1 DUF2529 domain-containing protein [Salipaludibacillus sp. CUR1]